MTSPHGPDDDRTTDPAAAQSLPVGHSAALDSLEERIAQIDLRYSKTQGHNDPEAITALWSIAFSLPQWWFLPSGPEGQIAPAAADMTGGLMLLGFTHPRRAHDFAMQHGMVPAGAPFDLLARTPGAVVTGAHQTLAAGAAGLVMDVHLTGFVAPFEQLEPMWRHVQEAHAHGG